MYYNEFMLFLIIFKPMFSYLAIIRQSKQANKLWGGWRDQYLTHTAPEIGFNNGWCWGKDPRGPRAH